MTLPRTIRRREKRQRAKARPKHPLFNFITPQWMALKALHELSEQYATMRAINTEYPTPTKRGRII